MTKLYWAVDYFDKKLVRLENDRGQSVNQPRAWFPRSLREGMVFRETAKGFIRDSKEEHRRLVEARAMLKRLTASDPGGDITT